MNSKIRGEKSLLLLTPITFVVSTLRSLSK